MAYRRYKRYKKSGYKGYYGRSIYRRSRRYRNKYWRRKRYRKRLGAKVEYKRIEGQSGVRFTTEVGIHDDPNVPNLFQIIRPYPYVFGVIGNSGGQNEQFPYASTSIPSGTGYSQRIGSKINPVKLRFYGTISLIPRDNAKIENEAVVGYEDIKLTQPIYLRMIIFQVRNGNTASVPHDKSFSAVNPIVKTGGSFGNPIGGVTNVTYNGSSVNSFHDIEFFSRIFECPSSYYDFFFEDKVGDNKEVIIWQGYDATNTKPYSASVLLKTPYKMGVGGSIKILKNKVFKVHPTTSQSITFRFKTKKPSRMVWPEDPKADNSTEYHAKNPIYYVLIPVFPYPTYPARLSVQLGFDMFYTDA